MPTKPLVRAVLFTLGVKGYAWIATDKVDEWRFEPIRSTASEGSTQWAEDAFLACVKAYRELQAAHPAIDMVISAEKCPVGREVAARKFYG